MRVSKFTLAFVASLLTLTQPASALDYPEDGWWWNAQASGRGYMIERQGNVMFIASFQYASNGRPEWLTIQGNYTPNTDTTTAIGTFSGQTYQSINGQCIGCSYLAPNTMNSAQGIATVSFTTSQRGTLNWQGESVPIQRFFWAYADTLGQLQGSWALSTVVSGVATTQLVRITSGAGTSSASTVSNLTSGAAIGTITSASSGLTLNITSGGLALPIRMPETKRFYAGASNASGSQIVATRIDDVPLATTASSSTLPAVFAAFGSNVTVIPNTSAGTVTLEAAGRPDHKSPYWNPAGTSGLYEAPGPETSVGAMSPGFIDQYTNRYFLTVPINPQKAANTTASNLGPIGLAITGSPIFNGLEGPNVNLSTNVTSGFDKYGAHTGPQVYHYHLELTPISNDDSKVMAILRDGFFLFGRKCTSVTTNNGHPSDLDASGGHTSTTPYSSTPVYHYHVKNQIYSTVNGKADYLLFDGAFQGTPNTISN